MYTGAFVLNMPIGVGTRLGPYELLAALGSGGKAQVYRARDPRVGREVAIKILPLDAAPQPDARDALLSQARAAIGKRFPHTCIVLDVGHDQGTDYLVLELIDGETLVEQLRFGPLPAARAIRYGRQMLEALDSARARGLVDRIVDPANVMVTPEGVKLLDFSWSPITAPRVHTSPERTATGRSADPRSDIFSFGMTLYEMLSGQKPFADAAAIRDRDPVALRALQPTIPYVLERIVVKCLEKDPAKRWQSIHDLHDALTWLEDAPETHTRRDARHSRRSRRRLERVVWAAAVIALVAIGTLLALRQPAPEAPDIVATAPRTTIALPSVDRIDNLLKPSIAMSPDGAAVAYVGTRDGDTALWVRRLNRSEATRLAGTEGAANPTFSPDGRSIAFAAHGRLLTISASGGSPIDLAPMDDPWGISWSRPDEILYASGFGTGIRRVPAGGGESASVTTLVRAKGEAAHQWPHGIPKTDVVLYARLPWRRAPMDDATIVAVSTRTGLERVLIEGGTQPRYLSTGHLVYSHGGTLYVAPLDLQQLVLTATPVPLVEGVQQSAHGAAHYSVSDEGRLVYLTGGMRGLQQQLVWVDRAGSVEPLNAVPLPYIQPRVSPDGRRVAARVVAPFCDVVMYDVAGDYLVRLPLDGDNHAPVWAEHGDRLLLQTVLPDAFALRWLRPDGAGVTETLLEGRSVPEGAVWSDADQMLVATDAADIVLMALGRLPTKLTETARIPGTAPALSTDGRWLAYTARVNGRSEIFVAPFPSLAGSRQVTSDGGADPAWASTGELFYRRGSRLVVAKTNTIPDFRIETPTTLFDVSIDPQANTFRNYDVTPDGQRFLIVKSDESISIPQAVMVADWFADVRNVK